MEFKEFGDSVAMLIQLAGAGGMDDAQMSDALFCGAVAIADGNIRGGVEREQFQELAGAAHDRVRDVRPDEVGRMDIKRFSSRLVALTMHAMRRGLIAPDIFFALTFGAAMVLETTTQEFSKEFFVQMCSLVYDKHSGT